VQFRRLRDCGDFATLRRPTGQRRPGHVFGCFVLVCPVYYHHRKTSGLEFSKFCERKEWVQEVPVHNSPIIACPALTKFAPAKRSCGERVMGQAVLGSIFVMTCWQRTVEMKFSRITVNPDQMAGVPCIRGLRIPVATVVGMVADEMNHAEILAAYPDLEPEDIREALNYAAETVRERELPLVTVR
jgi:uncharacterized protein (DUF433 family)